MLDKTFYVKKRKELAESMSEASFYFVCSGQAKESSLDQTFPFEPYRNFVYLTGLKVEKAMLLMTKVNGIVNEYLFMHMPTEREVRWSGKHFDLTWLKESSGIDTIMAKEQFEDVISRLLFNNDIKNMYIDVVKWRMSYPLNEEVDLANQLLKAYPYLHCHNAFSIVAKMRTIKEPEEIEAHRKACKITEVAVKNMLSHMKPGMKEYEIEAYYDFVLKSNGVKTPAFTTIAATGKNACYMHYMENDATTKDGDLILFDLGAQYDLYCADVSRTYPVNGKFTSRQRDLYNVVLKGLEVAESLSVKGQVKNELQYISKKVMAEELQKLGKIKELSEIDYYYFHGSGHYIGLDTHDVGDEPEAILEVNTMFTLEPGLYFDDEAIGIRIEDTLLVTDDKPEILSSGIPKTIEEIETYMARGREDI